MNPVRADFGFTVPIPDTFPTVGDEDTDGDGLSDFHEVHKYRTDFLNADSDNDGVADGDWTERREYTYSIRTVVRVMPPITVDALSDDYQDGRIRQTADEYVELEVVHYPLNTVAQAIVADADWRDAVTEMAEYIVPGPTTNWDEDMRRDLLARLAAGGFHLADATDREIVEHVSLWLMRRVNTLNSSAYGIIFDENGSPRLIPGTEDGFRRIMHDRDGTVEKQLQLELYGRGMYDGRMTGSCTSAANYLTTGLRATGIPTRMVRAIPCVDSSDPTQAAMVRDAITHPEVRPIILSALQRLGMSFAAHTYNEVFVGGRWRRLNYDRLGQNILDDGMGLMTHVQRYNDLAHAGIGDTWGRWNATRPSDSEFTKSNPYKAIEVSEQYPTHGKGP